MSFALKADKKLFIDARQPLPRARELLCDACETRRVAL
jgi:hypothetical protein